MKCIIRARKRESTKARNSFFVFAFRAFVLSCLRALFPCFLISLFLSQPIAAQLDTTKVYQIQEIEVAGNKATVEKSTVPLQTLDAQQLTRLNAVQVSDAVKYFAGVSVKDYGGIGGIKTVSVRSLGSTHTAISIDGIPVNDAQTGQIDIGRFSLANVESLSLVSGQDDNIFQPAKLFASASVLNIQSKSPTFEADKKFNVNLGSKFGSFLFFNPFVTYNQKLSEKFALTVDSEWAQTDGNYPFTFENGNYNINEKRYNSDVKKLRAETSLFGQFSDKDNLRLKLYYYQSEQGLPGAVIFENPTASSERIWDKNFSAQAHYQNDFSHLFSLQANTKFNNSNLRYFYINLSQQEIENNYDQNEYYLSTSLLFKPLRKLSFSLSCDGFYNSLDADLDDFAYPERYSLLTAFSTKYFTRNFSATASLLTTFVNEELKNEESGINEQKLSPFVSFSYQPFVGTKYFSPLRLRFFYKNIFRLPSFNDLYYINIGNPSLLPENTNQYNFGITYVVRTKNISPLRLTADVYYNNITNKIVASPTRSIFIWSMENLGKVEIKGLDLTVETKIMYNKKRGIWLQASYTYQEALDMTKTEKKQTYKHQLAYVPRFSGSGSCTVETPWFDVSYSVIISGKRYSAGQNIADNSLSGYADMSISLKRNFVFSDGKYNFFVQGEILNLLDDNYKIVMWYPMPGRTFRVSVSFGF